MLLTVDGPHQKMFPAQPGKHQRRILIHDWNKPLSLARMISNSFASSHSPRQLGVDINFHRAILLGCQGQPAFGAVHPVQFLQPTFLRLGRRLLFRLQHL